MNIRGFEEHKLLIYLFLLFYIFVFVRLNFSDAEIEIFIASYDADGNELLDVKEMQAVEQRRAPTAKNER